MLEVLIILKQKEFVGRIKKINPSLVCLIETKVKENNMSSIISKWSID